jgi:hypothetical protein
MIYEMLTGELPLGHFAPPSRRSGSDPALDEVVLQAMARDRLHRHQEARDLQNRLTAAASRTTAKAPAQSTPSQPAGPPAAWGQAAWELLLSGCSLLAAAVGFVGAGNVLDGFLHPSDLAKPLFGLPLLTFVTLVACLLSFVFARINMATRYRWTEVTWTQVPSLIPLITAYALFAIVLLAGPGLAVWLLGHVPRFAALERWNFLGHAFTAADQVSLWTPYWLRVYGVSLLACAAWCIPLAIMVRKHHAWLREVFYPSSQAASASLVQLVAIIVAALGALFGVVLLLAS